ncbi:HEAT repeat domain-containing protein [Thermanaeromonas sp.]|uniref:HEAT repeat domain-containing protein n=1 Tax=Thermanaeromonas sp. TaxID=2003697 RepID=UPI00261858B2|nr:HEAT repeat domain-containing protein [Thermanaeromonas sp.]
MGPLFGGWFKKNVDPERLKGELSCAARLTPRLKRLLRHLRPEQVAEIILTCWPKLCPGIQEDLKAWIKEEELVEEWLALLKKGPSRVRALAAEVLGITGQGRAVGPLLCALADRDESVQIAAAAGLSFLRDPRCLEPLALALTEPRGRIPPARIAQVLTAFGEAGLPYLLPLLERSSEEAIIRIVEVLACIGGPQVLPHLIGALKAPEAAVRTAAARALGEAGFKEAGDKLLEALEDEDPRVRSAAAYALGRLGHLKASPYLKRALEDPSWQVRISAEAALKTLEAVR